MQSRPPEPPRLHLLPDPAEIDEEAIEEQAARATSREMWQKTLSAGTTYAKLTAALESEYTGDIERAGFATRSVHRRVCANSACRGC